MLQWLLAKYRLVPQRYIMGVSCCLCTAFFNLLIHCQNHALRGMVVVQEPHRDIYIPGSHSCPFKYYRVLKHQQGADFYWSTTQISVVNKIMKYAKWFTMLPAGAYADLYGGRSVLTLGLLMSSVIYSILPYAARVNNHGYYIFLILLLLLTFCQGVVIPATSSIVAKCAAPNERATFIGMLHSGVNLGQLVGDIVSHQVLKWDLLFYLNSCVALVFAAMWYLLSRSQPIPAQTASENEVTVSQKRTIVAFIQKLSTVTQGPIRVPWLQILTSWAVVILALLAVSERLSYALRIIMTIYLQNVLFYNLPNNIIKTGHAFRLHRFVKIMCLMSSSLLSDYLITSDLLSLTTVRRLFVFLGSTVQVAFVIILICAGCNGDIVLACLMAIPFFSIISRSNVFSTPLDLCPTLCGTLTAIIIVISNSLVELFVQSSFAIFVSNQTGELGVWRPMYLINSALIVISALPYLVFPPSEKMWSPQPASNPRSNHSLSIASSSSRSPSSARQSFPPSFEPVKKLFKTK